MIFITSLSKVSKAAYMRQGGGFNNSFCCSSCWNAEVKELLKNSVHICQIHHKKTAWVFLT